jgi:hypothetical protein
MEQLWKTHCVDSRVIVHILTSTSVPFTLTSHNEASAKLNTNSLETDNNPGWEHHHLLCGDWRGTGAFCAQS